MSNRRNRDTVKASVYNLLQYVNKLHLFTTLSASSSEHHRMVTVKHKLREVHCPSEPHISSHITSHSLFNSLFQAAGDSTDGLSFFGENLDIGYKDTAG